MDLPACALAGLEVKDLLLSSCSSEKWVLWGGICSSHAPKNSRTQSCWLFPPLMFPAPSLPH